MTSTIAPTVLHLRFDEIAVEVVAPNARLVRRLADYFQDFVSQTAAAGKPSSLTLVDGETPAIDVPLTTWDARGKESFADNDGERIVRKDRTGVVIRLHGRDWHMEGPLSRNFSQVVNAIGAMFGIRALNRGGAMLHASYVARDGRGLAVIGQSGAGKSSVAVRLLERGFDFVSNDRLIVERSGSAILGTGLPKLPRVNPGTLLGGEGTSRVLDEVTRRRYSAMPREELWKVEDKYDLDVSATLGRRWLLAAPVAAILVLDWRLGGKGLAVTRLQPGQAVYALRGVIKDFGCFDQLLTRRTDTALRESAERVPVFQVTGGADPAGLASAIEARALPELAGLI